MAKISSNFEIPDLYPGQSTLSVTPIGVRPNSANKENILLNIDIDTQDWNYDLAIPIKPLTLIVDLNGDELFNNNLQPEVITSLEFIEDNVNVYDIVLNGNVRNYFIENLKFY